MIVFISCNHPLSKQRHTRVYTLFPPGLGAEPVLQRIADLLQVTRHFQAPSSQTRQNTRLGISG